MVSEEQAMGVIYTEVMVHFIDSGPDLTSLATPSAEGNTGLSVEGSAVDLGWG